MESERGSLFFLAGGPLLSLRLWAFSRLVFVLWIRIFFLFSPSSFGEHTQYIANVETRSTYTHTSVFGEKRIV